MTRHWHRVLHRYPPQSINRLPPHPATALLPLQACLSFYRLWHLFFLPEPFLRSLLPSFLPTNQRLSELLVLFPSFLLCVYPASSPPVQAQPSLNQPPVAFLWSSQFLHTNHHLPHVSPRGLHSMQSVCQLPTPHPLSRLLPPPPPRSAQSYTPRPLAAQWLSEPPCAPPLWTSMSAGLDRPGLSFPTKCSIGETSWSYL